MHITKLCQFQIRHQVSSGNHQIQFIKVITKYLETKNCLLKYSNATEQENLPKRDNLL